MTGHNISECPQLFSRIEFVPKEEIEWRRILDAFKRSRKEKIWEEELFEISRVGGDWKIVVAVCVSVRN